MTVILFAGKGLGLVREMFFTAVVGGGELADSFAFASLMPRTILDAMFAAAITASFIPIFTEHLSRYGKPQAFALANNFLNIVIAASALAALAVGLLAPVIVGLSAQEFEPYYASLTIDLLRIITPMIVLGCMAFTLVGVLQTFGQFYIPAAMSLLSNVVIIVYYVMFYDVFGIYGLALVFVLCWALQLLIQIPFLGKYGYKYSLAIDIKAPGIAEIAKLLAPAMLFTWVLPINLQINMFAVTPIVGGSTALLLSNTVYTIVTGVFVLSVANVIFPKLSRLAHGSDELSFGATLRGAMKGLLYLLIPMTVGLIVVASPLVRLLFLRGELMYTPETSVLAGTALSWFAVGIVGFGVQNVLARGFFSYKEGRTPLITGIAAVAVNALISFGLVGRMGIAAPALGSAIAMTLCAAALFVVMYARNKAIWDAPATLDVVKMTVCTIPMGVAARFALESMTQSGALADLTALILAAAVGVLTYLSLTYMLAVSEARLTVGYILRKLGIA